MGQEIAPFLINELTMSKFKFIYSDITDPFFNIASEEYLLKQTDGYYIYLWRNSPAVIIGVNQNALAEVNLNYTNKNDIKVVRRLTGGGAVYHDLDNLCYTVIAPFNEGIDNYKYFTKPVIDYLNSIGVKAEFSGRNDITVDGKKISGNAQTVYNGRIMHHGTLLFKTDVNALDGALKPNKLKIQSKGIKSIRARVTNIYDHLKEKISPAEFINGLKNYLKEDNEVGEFSKADIDKINFLVKSKYSTFEWNIGNSPKGQNTFEFKFDFGVFRLDFDTENGLIKNVKITGDFFTLKDVNLFATTLNGKAFDRANMLKAFESIGFYINGAKGEEIVDRLFS